MTSHLHSTNSSIVLTDNSYLLQCHTDISAEALHYEQLNICNKTIAVLDMFTTTTFLLLSAT